MFKKSRTIQIGLKLLIFFAFVSFCSIEMAPSAFATTYYVATNGNDSYNGLYPSYQGGSSGPFRTLNRAANSVRAGDTVYIRAGIYKEQSNWSANGNEGNPITVTNYNNEEVVIDGDNQTIPANQYDILLKISGDWYEVSNLEISYSGYYGLVITGDHCILDNIYCHHSWAAGITCSGSYCLVKNCRAWYNATRHEYGETSKWSTGISIMGTGANYSTLRNCTAWENWGQGIKMALTEHSRIEDCIAYNNLYNFYVRECRHCLFQRNLSYNTPNNLVGRYVSQTALLIGDEGGALTPSSDNTFINNLILGGERYNVSIGSGTFENCLFANNTLVNATESYNVRIGGGSYNNAKFQNNIILQENNLTIAINGGSTGITFGYNNWSKSPPSYFRGTGDIIANPLLVKTGSIAPGSLTAQWFRISENSPAKDRAVAFSEVPEDFFKNPRGSSPDMGAIELASGPTPLTATATGSPRSGQAPLAVNFTGSAGGGTSPYSYRWAFGDGGSSTAQNPSHTYSSAGTYTARLTITDNTSATANDSVNISVTTSSPLNVNIGASPTSGQAPLAVNFTGSASGGTSPYSYSWTFGDGGSSTSQNPSHTYSSAGTYTARLAVEDSAGSQDSDSLTITASFATVTQQLSLSRVTGAPAPGIGGTTNPSPGTHSYPNGDTVSVQAIASTDYRFSIWQGDIVAAKVYDKQITINMDTNKSLSAYFCTKCGDANGDLNVSPSDAQVAFDIYLRRISDPTSCQTENADVDCNGVVTPGDSQAIFSKFLGIKELPGDCSGKTRLMTAGIIPVKEDLSSTLLLIEDARVNSDGYVFVPIIIDNPVKMDAFGFDLSFPSDSLSFMAIESTELTEGCDLFDANVITSKAANSPLSETEPERTAKNLRFRSSMKRQSLQDTHRPDTEIANHGILRVGGFRTDSDHYPSYGVLATLVFRVTEKFKAPVSLSIIATFDDIHNASVINGIISPSFNSPIEENRQRRGNIQKKHAIERFFF